MTTTADQKLNVAGEEKRASFLKNENAAFESRLDSTKSELESLRKQRDALKADIEEDKKRHNLDVSQKQEIVRNEQRALQEARLKFEADKKEFEGILQEFQKNKVVVDREMQAALAMKTEAKQTMDRAGQFFVAVRNLANGL